MYTLPVPICCIQLYIYTIAMTSSGISKHVTTTSDSANKNITMGVTVGVILTIVVAILIIVCVIIMYRRKKKHSVSYTACPQSTSGY